MLIIHLQSESGERLSSISYHALRGVSLGSHGGRKRSVSERSGSEELWDNLERHILSEQAHPSKRFDPKEVRKMMQDSGWDFLVRRVAWHLFHVHDGLSGESTFVLFLSTRVRILFVSIGCAVTRKPTGRTFFIFQKTWFSSKIGCQEVENIFVSRIENLRD